MNSFNIVTFGLEGLGGVFLVSIFISSLIVGGVMLVGQWLLGGILFLLKWAFIIGGILLVIGYFYEKSTKKEETEPKAVEEAKTESVE